MYVYYVPLEGGGGGVAQKRFVRGDWLHSEVQPLTLLYTIFDRKGILSYTFYGQMDACSNTLGF